MCGDLIRVAYDGGSMIARVEGVSDIVVARLKERENACGFDDSHIFPIPLQPEHFRANKWEELAGDFFLSRPNAGARVMCKDNKLSVMLYSGNGYAYKNINFVHELQRELRGVELWDDALNFNIEE